MSKKEELVKVGMKDDWEIYQLADDVSEYQNALLQEYDGDSNERYGAPSTVIATQRVAIGKAVYEVVNWGEDNQYPQDVLSDLSQNMVAMQCQSFNAMCCYGQGARFVDRATMQDTKDEKVRDWCMRTALHHQFYRMCEDMKMFYWSVVLITLSRDCKNIVRVRCLDVNYCRLTKDMKHVIYGDWSNGAKTEFRAFKALDVFDPLSDLELRMGRGINPSTGVPEPKKDNCFQYAIVCRMPTPAFCYYPVAPWTSMFRDSWHDIYRLIGIGKREMIKNTSAPRVQIEVHEEYWKRHCHAKGLNPDSVEGKKEIDKKKQELKNFVCGIENVGKSIVTGYYTDINGKEQRMVRIVPVESHKKEGGDWSEDMAEAANSICFAMGVHPNLVGATPGKSQMNNSGSDKRELFTLKQATEKAFHDVMAMPLHMVAHYNGWSGITVDVPMIVLTTLDEHRDAKKVNVSNTNPDGNND